MYQHSQTINKKPFYFIRHGESEGNVLKLCQGRQDYPLTDKGIQQARDAATHLASLSIQTIVSSTLRRASDTAQIIAQTKPEAKLVFSEDLQERAWGKVENTVNTKMFEYERQEQEDPNYSISKSLEVESQDSLHLRIIRGINAHLDKPAPILFVGHGRFFNALCVVLGVQPIKQIPNGVPLYCKPTENSWQIDIISYPNN